MFDCWRMMQRAEADVWRIRGRDLRRFDWLRTVRCVGAFLNGFLRMMRWGLLAFGLLVTLPVAAQSAQAPTANLKIESFQLASGEKGNELWRLEAECATITHNGENIELESPSARYMLGNPADNDCIYVTASNGRVSDNRQTVSLWGNVKIVHGGEVVSGPLLEYRSQSREIVFPQGAVIESPSFASSAAVLRWCLDENRIEGNDGVTSTIMSGTAYTPPTNKD